MSPVLSLLPLSFLGFEALGGTLAIVLGLGVLIFVHELGHFLAAKWAGVKVEVFSLGMGPRLFGVVRGDTDYRISALPLGGYVKMLGQDDSDPTQERTSAPEDFRNKPPYKRFIILVAGVAMNTVFAMVAFIIAFAVGVEFVAPEVGAVVPGSAASQARVVSSPSKPAAQGLQESDQIVSINDTEILAWEDIQTAVALAGEKIRVEVDRPTPSGATERVVLEASPQRHEDEAYPQLGIQPVLMIAELDEGSPLKGKIEKGDQLIDIAPVGSAGAEPHKGPNLTLRAVQESAGKPVRLHLQRRRYDEDGRPLPESPRTFDVEVVPEARPVYEIGVDLELGERPRVSGVVPGAPAKGVIETNDSIVSLDGRPALASTLPEIVRAAGDSHAKAGEELSSPVPIVVERRKGNRLEQLETQVRLKRKQTGDGWQLGVTYAPDVLVRGVADGSPAATAGVKRGDRLTTTWTEMFLGIKYRGSKHVQGIDDIRGVESSRKDKPWKLGWERPDGTQQSAVVTGRRSDRVEGWIGLTPPDAFEPRKIYLRRGALAACPLGAIRTVRMIEQLGQTIRALISSRVSTRELGGPIQIAAITYNVSQRGFGKLLYFLAILSVNLAVLNVLPIPLLDGGHIFLLGIEKLKGRPVSDDVMKYVQYAGLLFMLGLMAYVFFNDIRRVAE